MDRHRIRCLALALALGLGFEPALGRAAALEDPASGGAAMPPGLARRAWEVTEAVLRHHLDPPARQQMMLDGLHRLHAAAGLPMPAGLGRRVSTITTAEQWAALLAELWPPKPARPRPGPVLEEALLDGLLGRVPGGAQRLSAKEHRVQEQLQGNRYVGIHIQLRYETKEKRSVIAALVPGGPADRAGARKEDRIEAIDGAETRDMTLAEVVDRLRGESGSELVLRVRQPGEKEPRTLKMIREPLFLPTVSGLSRRSSSEWDYQASPRDGIGYLRIRDISASTPHELRRHLEAIRAQGLSGVVLDLRGVAGSAAHPAVLLADALLDRGRIGRVRQADCVLTFDAQPGSLCPDWPLALLIDERTTGAAEWLAAAMQDNRRAVLVGRSTGGRVPRERARMPLSAAGVWSDVPLSAGEPQEYLHLLTGGFQRGDGRDLTEIGSLADPLGRPEDQPRARERLTPDVIVADRRQGAAPARRAGGMLGEEAPPTDPWTDPVLDAALKRLATASPAF